MHNPYAAPRSEVARPTEGLPRTLAFAERPGNRQFITAGNLSENPKAHLFLLDYGTRTRVKVWAEASVRTDDELAARLRPSDGGEVTGQVVVLAITACT